MVRKMKKSIKYSLISIIILSLFISSLTFLIPSPVLSKANYLELYDINGERIHTELYNNESKYIDLESLNDYTYQAFIAIEDKNFYKHNGFDLKRNIQAFFINLFSLSIKQGASTISQQYARNTLLNTKRTLSRKIKEAFYTIQIERKYTKNQILEGYLNSLYFGHGLTGIDAASKYYFNKSPSELTIAESAMIAGLCNAPSIYSPKIDLKRANSRKSLVLYQMFTQNYLTAKEYQSALKEEITYNFNKIEKTNFYYYKDAVIEELKSLNLYTKTNLQKGLKVYINIDYPLTKQINDLLENHQPMNKDTQIGIVIMEPFSNKIVYINGGFNYTQSSFNRALYSNRQIGSTIKPLLYSMALANGFSPNTLLTSEETTFNIENFGTYAPKNANNKYANDKIDMIQALALSDNIYALKTLLLLGSENFIKLLNEFEIVDVEPLPSIALGSTDTSLLKLTSIYNAFASLGTYYKPSFINKVSDFNDNIIYRNSTSSKKILDESNTLILNQMLTSTFDSSLSSYATPTMANYKPYNIYAAKSGTTSTDSYVMAYNPNYTIGIWVGSDSNAQLDNYQLPKKIFKEISEILETKKEPSWYSTNYHTKALRYNPNTHVFDTTGKLYYFRK
jgi:membrane peptidoglycan carboxypeptidase